MYRGRPQLADCVQYPGGGTAPSEGGWNARGGAAVPEPVRQSPIPVAQLRLQRPARAESRLDDWDPAARERLRDRIRLTNSGDTLLLLDDDDLDHALLMVVDGPYGPQPSLAGVLTIGKVDAIRRSMPMASEVFQVMKGRLWPSTPSPSRMPLVDMFSHINALKPWNPNHEIMSGLVHVNLPDFDRQAFREAMANAFCDPSSPLSNGIVGKVGRSRRSG